MTNAAVFTANLVVKLRISLGVGTKPSRSWCHFIKTCSDYYQFAKR